MEIKTKLIPIDFLPFIPHGYGNGYIGLPNTHPWYEKDYNDIDVNIHGGLTYSEHGVGKIREDTELWWIGFDTAHYQDSMTTCSKEYVEAEIESLKQQALAAIEKE